jgi:electron transport complex protein RnfG
VRGTLKLALILFVVCGVAAGSLALVNQATKDRIAALAKEAQQAARAEVFPVADQFSETDPGRSWTALEGGTVLGSVYLTHAQGYSGVIDIIFGVDDHGAITAVRILSQTETAGLGAKISTAKFLDQYAGKTRTQVALSKDDPANGQIDAITAATISSRAVTRAIRAAMDAAAGGQ